MYSGIVLESNSYILNCFNYFLSVSLDGVVEHDLEQLSNNVSNLPDGFGVKILLEEVRNLVDHGSSNSGCELRGSLHREKTVNCGKELFELAFSKDGGEEVDTIFSSGDDLGPGAWQVTNSEQVINLCKSHALSFNSNVANAWTVGIILQSEGKAKSQTEYSSDCFINCSNVGNG
jgi:hypothetical protein